MENQEVIENLVKIAKAFLANNLSKHDEYYKQWTDELAKVAKEDRLLTVFQVSDILQEEANFASPSRMVG